MSDNPFATPLASLTASSSAPASAGNQPFLFVAAMVAAAALLFFGSNGVQWITDLGGFRERLVQYLPAMIANWVGGLSLYAAAVLLLVHAQRERHGIAQFNPQAGLLAGFALLYLFGTLIVSTGVAFLSQSFYSWAFEQSARSFWIALHGQLSTLLTLVLGCLLPLWLVLRYARARWERLAPGQTLVLPSWHIALGVALCFTAVIYKLFSALSYGALYLYLGDGSLQSVFLLTSCVLPFLIVMAAVHTRLPAQVSRFAAGRVLAAAVALVALWTVLVLLVALLVAFAAYSSLSSSSLPVYLLPPAVIVLALLWPLARWCTGWFFAEQLVQSSLR
ncbi:hypothetical protein [Pseudomonas sp. PDNC002]|uniref:hypothetical protein n=1 Tax=Pseudomonas sp. PDNC002 TaxID=2811422 RepID=UPI001F05E289|nr:hypothetical protein [Pseudomonas sp. PDNC002]